MFSEDLFSIFDSSAKPTELKSKDGNLEIVRKRGEKDETHSKDLGIKRF